MIEYNIFTAKVECVLIAQGKKHLQPEDWSTLVHCFGYGKSVSETVEAVLHNRRQRADNKE